MKLQHTCETITHLLCQRKFSRASVVFKPFSECRQFTLVTLHTHKT